MDNVFTVNNALLLLPSVVMTLCLILFATMERRGPSSLNKKSMPSKRKRKSKEEEETPFDVLPCIRNRRSVFPKQYLRNSPPVDPRIIQSLLDAALWGPFHGKCFAGSNHPARFVVLGRGSMVEMQHLTLRYYDEHWQSHWDTKEDYAKFRKVTEEEITGRWAPCSYMIAIVMQRQAGSKRLPEWEEAAAVAAAVQNMHIQSTKFPHLACYWSSWHDAARDSDEMKSFLGMQDAEDKCLGFFIVAQQPQNDPTKTKDRRRRDRSLLAVDWRP